MPGSLLAQVIRRKADEMKKLCEGLDEQTASRAPQGRWSPKQIISHISGQDGIGYMPAVRLILEKDTPLLEIIAEDPFFTDRRSRLTMKELLAEFGKEYDQLSSYVVQLTDDQLSRNAHIPLFKDTELGEYPTLAAFISALAEWHVGFHITHMKEILQASE